MISHLIILGGALGPRLRGWVGAVGAELEVAVHELHPRRELLDQCTEVSCVGTSRELRAAVTRDAAGVPRGGVAGLHPPRGAGREPQPPPFALLARWGSTQHL